MSGARKFTTLALLAIALIPLTSISVQARDWHDGHHGHGGYHGHDGWRYRDAENRRDARRAGIVTGVVAAGIVHGAASANADRRYQDCKDAYGRYDSECERQRDYDEMRARDSARRAGVTAGVAAWAVTRD